MQYQYQCDNGHDVWIELPMAADKPEWKRCPTCKKRAHRIFGFQTDANAGVFTPYIEENITGQPILMTSRKQRDRVCAEHRVSYDRYSNLRPKVPSAADQITFDEVMTTAKKEIGEWK